MRAIMFSELCPNEGHPDERLGFYMYMPITNLLAKASLDGDPYRNDFSKPGQLAS